MTAHTYQARGATQFVVANGIRFACRASAGATACRWSSISTFTGTMDDPDPEFAGRLATADAVEFRRAQPPVGSLRAQTRGMSISIPRVKNSRL
jgi:hypothetical protein